MSRFARRIDNNHAEVRDVCRTIPGMEVEDVHALPTGIGDLFLHYRPGGDGAWCWCEVKSKGGKQTELQLAAQARWGEHYLLARDIDDILIYFGLLVG